MFCSVSVCYARFAGFQGFSYGLLTWLNAARDAAVSPACCAPRWGPEQTCSNKQLTTSLLGDDLAGVVSLTRA